MRKGAAISVLLLLLLGSGAVFPVEGGEGAGTGGRDGPRATILIYDVYDLQNMSLDVNGTFALANDIDASIAKGWNGGKGLYPVGSVNNVFNGTLDGRGFKISGLCINRTGWDVAGLFAYTGSAAKVSNLTLLGGLTCGGDYVAGLVAYNAGTVSNCASTGSVAGEDAVGGLVGYNKNGTISDCTCSGPVTASDTVGGVVGVNYGNISDCTSAVPVNASMNVGGLVGFNNGSISNCTSIGPVRGSSDVGGLVGDNRGTVSDCASNGTVSGTGGFVGGLAGVNSGTISGCTGAGPVNGSGDRIGGLVGDNSGTLSGCAGRGPVNGSRDYIGGLVGDNSGTVSGCAGSGPVNGTGWCTGGLAGRNSGIISGSGAGGPVKGMSDVGGLVGKNEHGTISGCTGAGAVNASRLVGGIVGSNYYGNVSDCAATGPVNGSSDYVGGLVGIQEGGTTSNCTRTGPVSGSGLETGGIAGWNNINGKIIGCTNNGSVTGRHYVGGIAGSSDATISDCVNNGAVNGSSDFVGGITSTVREHAIVSDCRNAGPVRGRQHVGGIVGVAHDQGRIIGCTNTGAVNGSSSYVGGIVGTNNDWGTVSACNNTGTVWTGGWHAGGIAGENKKSGAIFGCTGSGAVGGWDEMLGGLVGTIENGTVSDCLSSAPVAGVGWLGGLAGRNFGKVQNCTSTGPVSGTANNIGGFVGYNGGAISDCVGAGAVTGARDVGGLAGWNEGGTIRNCTSAGRVDNSGNDTGGLVGTNHGGTVSMCTGTGPVNGAYRTGGIAGYNDEGTISMCARTGPVRGGSQVGGIAGVNGGGTISDCVNGGAVKGESSMVGGLVGYNNGEISRCLSSGGVDGSSDSVGGFAGRNAGAIEGGFWDIGASGTSTSSGGTGKKTPELERLATYQGWDFRRTWAMFEDETYPFLRSCNLTALGIHYGLSIMNRPPTSIGMDEQYSVQLFAYDPDVNAKFSWSLDTNASWLALDSKGGLLDGTPGLSAVGSYRANVTVSSGAGGRASREFVLTVIMKHAPAWSSVPGDSGLTEGDDFCFTAVATDEDAGDVISYSLWSVPYCPIRVDASSGVISWPDVRAGRYSINLSATDGRFGIWHIFSLTVLKKNDPPAWASVPADTQMREGGDFRFAAKATDPDTGTTITYGLTSEPACGIMVDPSTGEIVWLNARRGSYSINLTASDGRAGIWHRFNITVLSPEPPVEHPPVWSKVPSDMGLSKAQEFRFTVRAADEDAGDALSYFLSSSPACNISIGGASGVIYWNRAAVGRYAISISATDGHFTIYHSFNLTVKNQPPGILTVMAPNNTRVEHSETLLFSVNAIDPNGDGLTYLWTENGTTLSTASSFTRVFGPGDHTVVLMVSDGDDSVTQTFNFAVKPAPKRPEPGKGMIPGFGAGGLAGALAFAAAAGWYLGRKKR